MEKLVGKIIDKIYVSKDHRYICFVNYPDRNFNGYRKMIDYDVHIYELTENDYSEVGLFTLMGWKNNYQFLVKSISFDQIDFNETESSKICRIHGKSPCSDSPKEIIITVPFDNVEYKGEVYFEKVSYEAFTKRVLYEMIEFHQELDDII